MSLLLILFVLAQSPTFDKYLAAQKAYAANPKSEDGVVALVSILYESNRNDAAIRLLEPFVKANPLAPRAKLFLALGYAREEKYAQAKTLATQVATQLPGDYYAHHILGLSLFGLNEFDAAESRFRKALSLKSDFADSFFELGLLYSRNPSALQQAQTSYEKAVALGYSNAEIYRNLGSVKVKLGKYEEAIADLSKALELNAVYADAYFQLADALRKSGKVEEAAEATKRFEALNASLLEKKQQETAAQALYERGMSLLQKDDLTNAYVTFKSAAETLPKFDPAFYRLAQLEYLHDDTTQALMDVRHALELNPFEPEYYFVLSRCLEDTDLGSAIDAAQKAISLKDSVADFHGLVGSLYEKSGDHVHAVQSYRRAVELEPKNDEFRKNLATAQRQLAPKQK
jgi:tetratricopeptide (TPR) repeat protein